MSAGKKKPSDKDKDVRTVSEAPAPEGSGTGFFLCGTRWLFQTGSRIKVARLSPVPP